MLVAVEIVIILKQIPHALGRANDYEGEFKFQQLADSENTISEIYRAIETASPGAMFINFVSMLFSWQRIAGRNTCVKNFPSALVVVVISVALTEFFGWPFLPGHSSPVMKLRLTSSKAPFIDQNIFNMLHNYREIENVQSIGYELRNVALNRWKRTGGRKISLVVTSCNSSFG